MGSMKTILMYTLILLIVITSEASAQHDTIVTDLPLISDRYSHNLVLDKSMSHSDDYVYVIEVIK